MNTQSSPWSEEPHNAEQAAVRPTAEDPIRFGIEDAVSIVSFSQVEGERLQGAVTGYFYDDNGEKVNIVHLNKSSAKKAGFEPGKEMRVPEWAISKSEIDEEPNVLTPRQKAIADFSLKEVADIGSPDTVDPEDDVTSLRFTIEDYAALRAQREAAKRLE